MLPKSITLKVNSSLTIRHVIINVIINARKAECPVKYSRTNQYTCYVPVINKAFDFQACTEFI